MEGQDSSLIAEEDGAKNRKNKVIYLLIRHSLTFLLIVIFLCLLVSIM